MGDGFMTYMLYLDDDGEDEPRPGERSGCGCLPSILITILGIVVIYLLGH